MGVVLVSRVRESFFGFARKSKRKEKGNGAINEVPELISVKLALLISMAF